ncbi:dienelactone hydrolase family protein [Paracoccus sp. MBLB3053]|uniref:Dienelactone hydrolase family protein n=1 Tax=Paracoccus aurantius TaxID=3073814 RepID=A0ABU2HSB4_9RHOB|nr:dienelactone hydrolase family protein [Paracoccus sp. MBLB3053]MDS9467460.1 dienelactone hydrolase family protein [Paracoccus sp. MBLB3053]
MTAAGITPDNLVPRLRQKALARGFPAGWAQTGGEFAEWQAAAGAIARRHILPDPALRERPCGWRTDALEDRGSHFALQGAILLEDDGEWPALMLRPKGKGPHPAALLLHDHGSEFRIGKEKCIRPMRQGLPLASEWVTRFFDGVWLGEVLAAQGFVVLAVDALGWGGRQGNGYASQQALACNLMQIGTSLAGVIAAEDMAVAEFLADLPEVDDDRICAIGFSLGGFRAWQVAALSPHVRAAVSAGWMASLPGLAVPGNNQLRGQSAFSTTHPGLHAYLDLPDLAGLAAPKPIWFEVGKQDHLFPEAAVKAGFENLAAIWAAADAGAQLRLERPAGGHCFGLDRQGQALGWLRATIGLTDSITTGSGIC